MHGKKNGPSANKAVWIVLSLARVASVEMMQILGRPVLAVEGSNQD